MKQRIIQWSTLVVAISILAAVTFYTRQLIAQQLEHPRPPQFKQPQRPDVAVKKVDGAVYNANIRGYGETQPHFSLTLTAQISGQIIKQAEIFESGCTVKKGEILLLMENSDYQSAVADAKNELASTRLALLEEQREASQAQVEWQASGLSGEPDSDLVMHKPQLDAAKAAVTKAETALASAEKNLSRTIITSPFDAIVVERLTAPGSYLQAGTEGATLYSIDMIGIPVALSMRDWRNLPDPAILSDNRWPVQLTSVENGQTWSGRVLRAQQHIDATSRQRTLLVAVDSPLDQVPPLLPGTFIEARISGSKVDNIWKLPKLCLESAWRSLVCHRR